MSSFKDSTPDKDYVNNMLQSKVGTDIEPLLVNISAGTRKNSVNWHFLSQGAYFYAQTKRQQKNSKGNTLVTLRCPNFQSKCQWNGRIEYLKGEISPENDDFYNPLNWKVHPVPTTPNHFNMSGKNPEDLPTTLQCRGKDELAKCCDKSIALIWVKVSFESFFLIFGHCDVGDINNMSRPS